MNQKYLFFFLLIALSFAACSDDDMIPEPTEPTTQEIEAANIATVRSFYEALINQKDNAAVLNLLADDFYDNDAIPGQVQSAQGKVDQISGFFTTFPNATVNTDTDQMYTPMGKYVAVYSDLDWQIDGPGFFGIEPTGQDITLSAIDIWEVVDGKIIQAWHTEDFAGVAAFQLMKPFCPDGMAFFMNRVATTNVPAGTEQIPDTNFDELTDEEISNLELVKKHYRNLLIDFDFTAARENLADNFVDNNAFPGEVGPDAEIMNVQGILGSFADISLNLNQQWLMVDGDMVIGHTNFDTPYNGQVPFFGIPVSNTDVSLVATDIWRIENGKIAEVWHVENLMEVALQAGAIVCP